MATVKFSDEMPKPTSIKGTDRFLISDGVTGEAKAPDFNQAKEYLNITGIEMEPLVGGDTEATALVVSNGPAGEQRTAEVSSGKWYDFGSGPVQASADRRWKSYWSGTAWSLKDMGELPTVSTTGEVEPGDTNAVSGDKVYNALQNNIKDTLLNAPENLLTGATFVQGKYIDSLGVPQTNASFSYYSFPITSQILFIEGNFNGISAAAFGAYFNDNDEYISGIASSNAVFILNAAKNKGVLITPELGATVKLSVLTAGLGNYKVYDGMYSYPKDTEIQSSYLGNVLRLIDDAFVTNVLEGDDFYKFFDFGYFRYRNNQLEVSASTSINSTGMIPVNENDLILVEEWLSTFLPSQLATRGQWFGANKRRLSDLPAIDNTSPTYTAPIGAKYVSIVFENVKKDDLSVKIIAANPKEIQLNAKALFQNIGIISPWNGKKWVSFGHSNVERNTWQPYVVSALGLVHTNLGIGSTCMINAGPTPMVSQARIDAVLAANPDIITILAGSNDLLYIDGGLNAVSGAGIGNASEMDLPLNDKNLLTYYGAYSYFIEKILLARPRQRIVIMGVTYAHQDGKRQVNPPTDTRMYNSIHTYSELKAVEIEIAKKYGLPFIDVDTVGLNKMTMGASPFNIYSSDQIHFNTASGKLVADLVIGKLRTIEPISV